MQKKNKQNNVRLSTNVSPIEYDITLNPDLNNFTFEGFETIHFSILKTTKIITLHSKDLEIETVSLEIKKEKIFAKISYNEKNETVDFSFPKNIPSGKHKLNIVFKGILNDKMRGFYRSKYFIENKEHHIATTQFEATDARRAFPCFDEPAHKAIFNVSLVIPKGKTAISNTLPVNVAEHSADLQIIKFAPTPKMSTYLLAFIVGDFEYLEKKSKNGVQVRVYTTPGKKNQASFALDTTVKVLDFYEEYFDIPYPINTLDMIAIPDFTSLAMENWGAITFREMGLLIDEKNSSVGSKELVAEVIAHEIAHQWFGNLVTMEWWTHLWLNEGFASYIPYLAIHEIFPKWNVWERFTTDTQGIALKLDSLKTTHPIEIEVHHPDEIGEIFDAVSYSKGASIIRMLAEYLGEKDFRDGLRYYLKKHSYKNTETIHLWKAFEKVSKKKVSKMMHNWTSRPGYPLVKAKMVQNKLITTQTRFFSSPISAKNSQDKTKWDIPITFKMGKINFGETGFYRVAYSTELLEKLKLQVQNKTLGNEDRLGIIRDLFALAEAGIVKTTEVLNFLTSYKDPARNASGVTDAGGEDSFIVWIEIISGLVKLEQILSKTKSKEYLSKFILEFLSPIFNKLNFEKITNEIHTNALLRSMVISTLGKNGHKEIIKEAQNRFTIIKKGGHIDPDIRGAIYAIIASNGNNKDFQDLIKLYKKETLHEEKNRIGNALGYFKDKEILKAVCEFSVSKDVRNQDTVSIINNVGLNPLGRDIWWNFVKKNWKKFVTNYGYGGHTLSRLIKAISNSAEEKHFKDFKKFFATHEAPGAKRSTEQVLEKLEGNIAWLKRDEKIIEEFLK